MLPTCSLFSIFKYHMIIIELTTNDYSFNKSARFVTSFQYHILTLHAVTYKDDHNN